MTALGSLLDWWNLIFAMPLGIAAIYLVVTSALGLGGGEGDHDAAHEVGHEVGQDVAHEAGHEAADGHDHDHDGAHDEDRGGDLLGFLGARRTSLMLCLEVLCIAWGISGLMANAVLEPRLGSPAAFLPWSVLVAGLVAVGLTRSLTGLLSRVMPKEESAALRREDLEGLVGQVVFSVDADSGAVRVRDRFGHSHQVACRSHGEVAARGAEVVLVEYVAARDYFLVEPLPAEWPERPRLAEESPAGDGTVSNDA